jgi:hypothetical protein
MAYAIEAAKRSIKWALYVSATYIVIPLAVEFIIGLAGGNGVDKQMIEQRLNVGMWILPIGFTIFWLMSMLTKKDPVTRAPLQSNEQDSPSSNDPQDAQTILASSQPKILTTKARAWNYAGIGFSVFMLIFIFIPKLLKGSTSGEHLLGTAFWVGVIIYCSLKIFRARRN